MREMNYRRRITKNPMPTATAPAMTAGSTGDSGVGVGHDVGTTSVDFRIMVAVVTGLVGAGVFRL